jgi:error-prone DNA polymerase
MHNIRNATPFAELIAATNFSFLRGASHSHEMVGQAAELKLSAIGIADRNSLAGVVRAWVAGKEHNIRVLAGARLVTTENDATESFEAVCYPVDRTAYGGLCRLLTLGNRRAPKGQCHFTFEDLLAHAPGQVLIAIPPRPLTPIFVERLHTLAAAARGRTFLAAAFAYRGDERRQLGELAELARQTGAPLIATADALYHHPARRPLADVLACIGAKCTIAEAGYRLEANAERHLKPAAEMARLFADYPQAVARTAEIAQRIAFDLSELRYEYPDEPVPPGKTPQAYLEELTWRLAAERYKEADTETERGASHTVPSPLVGEGQGGGDCRTSDVRVSPTPNPSPHSSGAPPARRGGESRCARGEEGVPEPVKALIAKELALIAELDYARYFLTVYDVVRFARENAILCQGRGSAANSAVCYCLGITAVDPTRINVLFERFISAERREPPDIDVDFEHERREEVIQYLYRRYGRERAAICATVIHYRPRMAIREVGKALGLKEDVTGALAGLVWGMGDDTIPDAHVREAGLDPANPKLRQTLALARQLLGFPRHLSQHVGGFVLTRERLDETVPVINAAMPDRTNIEWDKDDIDAIGMLKVDVLALGMLTAIRKAIDLINRHYGKALTLADIPPEDPAVYDMLCRADSVGVFQVESRAQMSMLPRLQPRRFYDLVIEVAIVRPGPIQGDMVHPYLRRREGKEPVEYPSEALRAVLDKTCGVPLFQEQAMQIAIVGAGFSPGEADRLRRAMATFRHVGTIHTFRENFIGGMVGNGYARDFAERCFSQIEGFGEYGFPESHAASFALLVYVSAWIKRHYPEAFCTALLNSQPMGFYAPAQLVRDARDHGVEVLHPDVNHSEWDCTLEAVDVAGSDPAGLTPGSNAGFGMGSDPQGLTPNPRCAVRLGLRLVGGLNEAPARQIVAARGAGYASVGAVWLRSGAPVGVLERLADADAFRSTGLDRRAALWAVKGLNGGALRAGARRATAAASPVRSWPGSADLFDEQPVALPPASLGEHVVADYAALGLSLKAHPVAFFRKALSVRGILTSARHWDNRLAGRRVTVAGLVLVRQRPGTAKGTIFLTLEDETGIVNVVVWPKVFERCRRVVMTAQFLAVRGKIQREGLVIHVVAEVLIDLTSELSTLGTGEARHPAERQHREGSWKVRSRDFH